MTPSSNLHGSTGGGRLCSALVTGLAIVAVVRAVPAAGQDLTQPGAEAGVVVQSPPGDVRQDAAPADDSPRVRAMEHMGFKLGMEAKEVEQRLGTKAEIVTGSQEPPVVRFYRLETEMDSGATVTLRFDRNEELYFIQSNQVLKPGITASALRQSVEAKYGAPDVGGWMGLGTYRLAYVDPSAELNVLADIALAGQKAPTTIRIELVDHAREAQNEAAFQQSARTKNVAPEKRAEPTSRVDL